MLNNKINNNHGYGHTSNSKELNGDNQYDDKQNAQTFHQYFDELQQALKQKNQIIQHLSNRIKNQQRQIDMLVTDAQEKNLHEITKHYRKSYEKFMKYGKYLLIKIEEEGDQANGIYLSKCAKIVHFGEVEVLGIKNKELASLNNLNDSQNNGHQQQNIINKQTKQDGMKQNTSQLKLLQMNKQQSTFQSSVKGLSLQIQQLKQKLKTYSAMVNQKSASKLQKLKQIKQSQLHKQNSTDKKKPISLDLEISKSYVDSNIGNSKIDETPIQKSKISSYVNQPGKQYYKEEGIGQFTPKAPVSQPVNMPSISPVKKRKNTKTIFIRKG